MLRQRMSSMSTDGPTSKVGQLTKLFSEDDDALESPQGQDRERARLTKNPSLANPGLALFSKNMSGDAGGDERLSKMFSWGQENPSYRDTFGSGQTSAGRVLMTSDGVLIKKVSSIGHRGSVFFDRSAQLRYTQPNGSWALELVALINNGIRLELRDMYKMFACIEQCSLMLTAQDMDEFFKWYQQFADMLSTVMEAEETGLYAWIQRKDQMSREARKWDDPNRKIQGELSEGRRMRTKGQIMLMAGQVTQYGADAFVGRPVAEALPGLARRIDDFVQPLLEYFVDKECILPKAITENSHLTVKDRVKCEEKTWAHILKNPIGETPGEFGIVMGTRWMDKTTLRKWKRKYFKAGGRREYERWSQKYQSSHVNIVSRLERKVADAERERKAQVAESASAIERARRANSGDGYVEEVRESGSSTPRSAPLLKTSSKLSRTFFSRSSRHAS